jgi:hypothetical protein
VVVEVAGGIDAVAVCRLAFLGQWCAPGRPVDRRGGPVGAGLAGLCARFGVAAASGVKIRTLQDVPQVEELWRLAVQADVVRAGRKRVVPGPRAQVVDAVAAGEADEEVALELWLDAFGTAVIDEELDVEVAQQVDRVVKAVLGALYDARSPVTLADVEGVLEGVMPDWVDDEDDVAVVLFAQIGQSVELFRRLHRCGAVSIRVAADAPDGADELAAAVERPEQAAITLTPLGVYGVREYLLGTGCDAPVTAE